MSSKARWWHTDKDRVVCDLCPRHCRLPEGKRGFCFVRQNLEGEMTLTTHGQSTSFCIDPIEKKPLNHFLPGTPILSFGTAGCNLGCKFCQNWDMSKSREIASNSKNAPPESIVRAAQDSGCRSIAFTYNEPVIWAEYAIETAILAHTAGLKTVAVTSGYISDQARSEFFEHIDAANVDLKSIRSDFYRQLASGEIEPVLNTLKWLKHESNVWFEITNLLIPDENDSSGEIEEMCRWILDNLGPDVPLHLSAFHPDYKMRNKPRTPHETLIRAYDQATALGLQFVYVGNVLDRERQSTYCPSCKNMLIERDHYELGKYTIANSRCSECETEIPGHFEEARGDWGRTRVPLKIDDTHDTVELTLKTPEAAQAVMEQITAVKEHIDEASEAVESLAQQVTQHPPEFRALPEQAPRTDFSEEDGNAMLEYARDVVQSALHNRPTSVKLKDDLANAAGYGVFVTLRRGGLLRGCRGHWGDANTQTVGALIESAARSSTVADPRFPSIVAEEYPFLTLEISLMHDPQVIKEQGDKRVSAVEVGVHGLVISHPKGRGLLLPHVATENRWNAKTFLERVSAKAGLPTDAWLSNDSHLMNFRTCLFVSKPQYDELETHQLPRVALQQLLQIANILARQEAVEVQVSKTLLDPHREPLGVYVENQNGLNATAFSADSSLLKLAEGAVSSLRSICSQKQSPLGPITRITLLSQPILLRPDDYPTRHGTLIQSAILARHQQQTRLILRARGKPPDKVGTALASLNISPDAWKSGRAQLIAFSPLTIDTQRTATRIQARQPMCPGSFYPKEPQDIHNQLETLLESNHDSAKKSYRAVMLPHAGWRYCGDIIGNTLAHVKIPDRVIVIGPKHTRYGALWSVSSDDLWLFPHAQIQLDVDLAKRLEQMVPSLVRESEAHRIEHSIEVLLPFFHHLNPNVQVVPIALGNTTFEALAELSNALAKILESDGSPPLLAVSTDLNHYASEDENNRLDNLALDALQKGNPKELYDTCKNNEISMCGMLPTVTVMQALQENGSEIRPQLIGYHTSAPVNNDTSRVVGYAGVLFE